MTMEVREVKERDRIPFRCQQCGQCCRKIENSVMLEPPDVYHLSRHLRDMGEEIEGPEDFLSQYAVPQMLFEHFPIFVMKSVGPEQSCIFLKNGRCSVYAARPKVCRLYPFSLGPGKRGRDFQYALCLDRSHHFTGGTVLVKDWFYENLSRDLRGFNKAEFEDVVFYGKAIRKMGDRANTLLPLFLYFRYFAYDLSKPFLPQFEANRAELCRRVARSVQRHEGR